MPKITANELGFRRMCLIAGPELWAIMRNINERVVKKDFIVVAVVVIIHRSKRLPA